MKKKELFKDVVFCMILFTLICCALMNDLCATLAVGFILLAFQIEVRTVSLTIHSHKHYEREEK